MGFVGDAVADTVDDFREKGPDHELQLEFKPYCLGLRNVRGLKFIL